VKVTKLGFIVNPIAGMGGSVGLKGTDGELFKEALRRGAKPVAPTRALRFLNKLMELRCDVKIITPPYVMGGSYVGLSGAHAEILRDLDVGDLTSREDTLRACSRMLEVGVDVIAFVGGDGTARDIYSIVRDSIPILGIPSGVKMYSGVFASNPEAAAVIISSFAEGRAEIELGEIADVNESCLSNDVLKVNIYGIARVPSFKDLLVPSKDFSVGDELNKEEVASFFISSLMEPDVLYILGPGSTTKAIAKLIGVEKTLLGVDAVYNGKLVGKDLSEKELLNLIEKFRRVKIVLTPIGRQGFIIGRGNQQISPNVIRRVGRENIIIVATRDKMRDLKFLRVDTGDAELDREFQGYVRVIVGYNEEVIVRVVGLT